MVHLDKFSDSEKAIEKFTNSQIRSQIRKKNYRLFTDSPERVYRGADAIVNII